MSDGDVSDAGSAGSGARFGSSFLNAASSVGRNLASQLVAAAQAGLEVRALTISGDEPTLPHAKGEATARTAHASSNQEERIGGRRCTIDLKCVEDGFAEFAPCAWGKVNDGADKGDVMRCDDLFGLTERRARAGRHPTDRDAYGGAQERERQDCPCEAARPLTDGSHSVGTPKDRIQLHPSHARIIGQ